VAADGELGAGATARHGQLVVHQLASPRDYVLPVGVDPRPVARELVGVEDRLVTFVATGVAFAGILVHAAGRPTLEVGELLGIEDLHVLPDALNAEAGIVGDAGRSLTTGIGGDQDDAVRRARAVDCGGGGVLEHLDRLDAVRIDVVEAAGDGEPVHD